MTPRDITTTVLPVTAMLWVGLPRRGGTWLIVLVPVVVLVCLYLSARAWMRPAERSARFGQMGCWLGGLAIVAGAQACWSAAARETGDAVVAAVLRHRSRTGTYPDSLTEVGFGVDTVSAWRMVYRTTGGKAILSYPAQVMPLSTHEYDFESGRWVLNAY